MRVLHKTQLIRISQYLGQGPGANWRQLAESFGHNDIIELFVNEYPKESSTKEYSRCVHFLEFLITSEKDLTVQFFIRKCKEISRDDVAKVMDEFL